jgi:uncharacterized protein (UPF0548 family)
VRESRLSSVDETALGSLRARGVNYDPAVAPGGRPDGHWHVDAESIVIGREAAGGPAPGGPWEMACRVVAQYEFTDGRIVRAVYRPADDLLGRDMLLEGRFGPLRFYLGVRVTGVTDETRDGGDGAERVWGWSYQTLDGHLEQGRLSYEVIKNLASGRVMFRVSGYSRRAPIPNPVIRLGFMMFGRWTQRRFYGSVQRRMLTLVQAGQRGAPIPHPVVRADGIAIVPSGAGRHPLERLAAGSVHPGR